MRECKAFVEKNDIQIIGTYIDRALSAKTDNRPDFQRMIKESSSGMFNIVIVWKLDRFARNRYDSAHCKSIFRKNGVKVVSATELISDSAEGVLLESMLEGMAEYYSAELSEKVVRGLTENALKCKYNGGTPTFGFAIDKDKYYQIDPHTAPVVLEMFIRYDKGETMKNIRDWLNGAGVTTVRGKKIDLNFVAAILHNRKYIGEYSYRHIVTPGGIPAIVPKELFDRVQEKMAKNKKSPARHKAEDDYLLTTKLFCGYCGAYLCGESGTSRTGVVHHYYKCVSVKKKRTDCHKKPVRKEWLEDMVVNATMKMLMNDATIDAIVSALMTLQDEENVNLPLYEKQLRETKTAIDNLLNAIQQGLLTRSTKERLDALEAAQDELENKIACEKLAKPRITEEQLRFFLEKFRKMDVANQAQRKMLIDTFVNAIFLYDDKVVLTYNFHEGTETISFEELQKVTEAGASGSDLVSSTAPAKSFRENRELFCLPKIINANGT